MQRPSWGKSSLLLHGHWAKPEQAVILDVRLQSTNVDGVGEPPYQTQNLTLCQLQNNGNRKENVNGIEYCEASVE
jgi:hypothetical protein